MVQLELRQIRVPPGQRLQLENVSWADFEAILDELGEHRGTRIAYSEGILEIMAPLPEHETAKVFIGDFVKILLDETGVEWISLGSTTFKQQFMAAGIEPDDCFYIQNCRRMVGRDRLDLAVDPPPDLAIEVDLTSRTQISAYASLRIPEVWCYDSGKLHISVLRNGNYVDAKVSPTFPNFFVFEVIPQFIKRGQTEVMSSVRRAFQQWVRERLTLSEAEGLTR